MFVIGWFVFSRRQRQEFPGGYSNHNVFTLGISSKNIYVYVLYEPCKCAKKWAVIKYILQSASVRYSLVCLGWGYYANFLRSVIFQIFQYCQDIRQQLNITCMFDRCHRSLWFLWVLRTTIRFNQLTNGASFCLDNHMVIADNHMVIIYDRVRISHDHTLS